MQLMSKSTNLVIPSVVVLHVIELQALLDVGVIQFWHMPINNCSNLWLFVTNKMHFGWKEDEKKIHVNDIWLDSMTNNKCFFWKLLYVQLNLCVNF
jgi:hypothetical protein